MAITLRDLSFCAKDIRGFWTTFVPESVRPNEETTICDLFRDFEQLGPVGAAKALHLLAPNVFPLWDRAVIFCQFSESERRSGDFDPR